MACFSFHRTPPPGCRERSWTGEVPNPAIQPQTNTAPGDAAAPSPKPVHLGTSTSCEAGQCLRSCTKRQKAAWTQPSGAAEQEERSHSFCCCPAPAPASSSPPLSPPVETPASRFAFEEALPYSSPALQRAQAPFVMPWEGEGRVQAAGLVLLAEPWQTQLRQPCIRKRRNLAPVWAHTRITTLHLALLTASYA